jgi:isopenicillin-N epimerase
MTMTFPSPSSFASHWDLDPEVVFLNHGSFGACPRVVMQRQAELRREMEAQPLRFLHHTLEERIDAAKPRLAKLIGCDAEDLALIANATSGVNTVLRSLTFAPGDELLVTDHEYNSCRNALDYVAERSGARIVVVPVAFPVESRQQIIDDILAQATERTRLCLIDHVTSPTGMIMPVSEIVHGLNERGIDTLVDGAHAPGMLPLDLTALNAAYYTGNCHKWLCTPKGSALLFVRRDRQAQIRPLTISHGANSPRTDRSRFRLEFDFTGTNDFTAVLCIPDAIAFLESLLPGGIPALQKHNHDLAMLGREKLCRALGTTPPVPEEMIGSLASVVLPATQLPASTTGLDPLQTLLWEKHRVEVPVMHWPQPALRLLRISPQIYNSPEQYDYLAKLIQTSV